MKERTEAGTSRRNGFSSGHHPVGRTAGSTNNLQNNIIIIKLEAFINPLPPNGSRRSPNYICISNHYVV